MERRLTATLPTEVVGCRRLMVVAGMILATSSQASAYHETLGGGAEIGPRISIGAFLPIFVGLGLVMVGVGIWDWKKRKTKSKRRRRKN